MVVIARYDGDVMGIAEIGKPLGDLKVLISQPYLGQIAGDHGMINGLALEVLG